MGRIIMGAPHRAAYAASMRFTLRACLVALAALPAAPAVAQVVLVENNGISFGQIDYKPGVSGMTVQMGSNGNVIYDMNTEGGGFGTAGQIEIQATAGTQVSIACDSTGTLAKSGQTLALSDLRFNVGSTNVAAFSGGVACTGLANGVATHTTTGTPTDDTLYIGGALTINGMAVTSGSFSAANVGGTLPSFRVLVI